MIWSAAAQAATGAARGAVEADLAMLEYVEKLTVNPSQMTKGDLDGLRRHFSEEQCYDIVLIASLFNFIDRIADAFGVELDAFASTWPEQPPKAKRSRSWPHRGGRAEHHDGRMVRRRCLLRKPSARSSVQRGARQCGAHGSRHAITLMGLHRAHTSSIAPCGVGRHPFEEFSHAAASLLPFIAPPATSTPPAPDRRKGLSIEFVQSDIASSSAADLLRRRNQPVHLARTARGRVRRSNGRAQLRGLAQKPGAQARRRHERQGCFPARTFSVSRLPSHPTAR